MLQIGPERGRPPKGDARAKVSFGQIAQAWVRNESKTSLREVSNNGEGFVLARLASNGQIRIVDGLSPERDRQSVDFGSSEAISLLMEQR